MKKGLKEAAVIVGLGTTLSGDGAKPPQKPEQDQQKKTTITSQEATDPRPQIPIQRDVEAPKEVPLSKQEAINIADDYFDSVSQGRARIDLDRVHGYKHNTVYGELSILSGEALWVFRFDPRDPDTFWFEPGDYHQYQGSENLIQKLDELKGTTNDVDEAETVDESTTSTLDTVDATDIDPHNEKEVPHVTEPEDSGEIKPGPLLESMMNGTFHIKGFKTAIDEKAAKRLVDKGLESIFTHQWGKLVNTVGEHSMFEDDLRGRPDAGMYGMKRDGIEIRLLRSEGNKNGNQELEVGFDFVVQETRPDRSRTRYALLYDWANDRYEIRHTEYDPNPEEGKKYLETESSHSDFENQADLEDFIKLLEEANDYAEELVARYE